MKGRWKKLVAILGVTALVVGQNGGMIARADELPTDGEEVITTVEDESADEESSVQEDATEQKSTESSEDNTKETPSTEVEDDSVEDASTEQESTESTEDTKSTEDFEEETPTVESTVEMPTEAMTVAEEYGIMLLAEDVTETGMPTELGWDDYRIGTIKFKHNMPEADSYRLEYYIEVYKDGELKDSNWSWSMGTGTEYCTAPLILSPNYDFVNHETYRHKLGLTESGTYKYRLKVKESNNTSFDFSEGMVSEFSSEYQYTKTDATIDIPKNLKWNDDGILEWDTVEGASYYNIYMYDGQTSRGFSSSVNSYDLSEYLIDDTVTYVAVVSANNSAQPESIYGDYSEEIKFTLDKTNSEVNNDVSNIIDKVDDSSSKEEVAEAVGDLAEQYQGEDKNKLQIAMQSDAEVQNKIKELEALYAEKSSITTQPASIGEGVDLDSSKISLIGAALNANENSTVRMNIKKPEPNKNIISNNKDYLEERYANAVQLSMDVTGINSSEDLAIPITITMPIPDGINPDKLVILHEQANGKLDRVVLKVNKEEWTVSFTVTHFSEFIFAEEITDSGSTDSGSTNLDSTVTSTSSSDDGSSTTVYVPSWKPTTPDEIKRYSFFGKEKVNFVADVANAYPVTVVNAMQGKLCFDVFEAVLGDYTMGRTYNIFPAKKATYNLYKMDKAAKITLTIPKALQAVNREYKMICVTKGGLPIILEDIDVNPNTITFETDTYYAFALVYKDAVVLQ